MKEEEIEREGATPNSPLEVGALHGLLFDRSHFSYRNFRRLGVPLHQGPVQ